MKKSLRGMKMRSAKGLRLESTSLGMPLRWRTAACEMRLLLTVRQWLVRRREKKEKKGEGFRG